MAYLVDPVWGAVASIASWWLLAVLVVLILIFWFGLFAPRQRAYLPARTFDGRKEGYRASQIDGILREFSDEGLQTYLTQASVIDMIFPILYSLAAAIAILLFAPRLEGFRWLILLPFLTALADYIENFCVITVIGKHRRGQEAGSAGSVLAMATRVKFILWGAMLVALAVLVVGWVVRAAR